MYTIRILRKEIPVTDLGSLMAELCSLNGSVSVIATSPNGMRVISYVDVKDGVVRKSYGDRRVLKTPDFTLDGEAFA